MSERNTFSKDGKLIGVLVSASTTIEAGKMVAFNASGYLVEASDASGVSIAGVADETVDNSTGSNGDLTCLVKRNQLFKMKNSTTNAVDIADQGNYVFVEDDETVADVVGTNGVIAGVCIEVASDGVWIEMPPIPQVAAQAASTANDVAGAVTDLNALIAKLKAAGIMANA
ncbi:head fiber protein [uncultured Desulfuromusa sp.]|uniref:head fiber protein n=1 Tax=uncultured Desulfuromusa sp. TaxID=219183 RepID=UPI002AA63D79|nr:head fiber protein [uncultured Desulfuromusa sp.]